MPRPVNRPRASAPTVRPTSASRTAARRRSIATSRSSARRAVKCRRARPAIHARSTCGPARRCGSSRPSRRPASRSTRRGATAGKIAPARTCGRSPRRSTRERGIAYLPIAGPAANYYGGDRPGNDVFGNSIVAVEATTGKYLWHFQTVHHDLWDTDMPSGGALFEFVQNGQRVPAIAQVGKSSFFYVLNRQDRRAADPGRGKARAEGRRADRVVLADAADSRCGRRRLRARASARPIS